MIYYATYIQIANGNWVRTRNDHHLARLKRCSIQKVGFFAQFNGCCFKLDIILDDSLEFSLVFKMRQPK